MCTALYLGEVCAIMEISMVAKEAKSKSEDIYVSGAAWRIRNLLVGWLYLCKNEDFNTVPMLIWYI